MASMVIIADNGTVRRNGRVRPVRSSHFMAGELSIFQSESRNRSNWKETKPIKIKHDGLKTPNLVAVFMLALNTVLQLYKDADNVEFGTLCNIEQLIEGYDCGSVASVRLDLKPQDTIAAAMQKALQSLSHRPKRISLEAVLVIHGARERSYHAACRRPSFWESNGHNLAVLCEMASDSTSMRMCFNEKSWNLATVDMMRYQMCHAFNLVASCTALYVHDLRGISPQGLRALSAWNHDGPPKKLATSVFPLIEKRFREQPFALAIDAWDGQVTYRELEKKVTAVATSLISAGLKPGEFVGLLLEKSMTAPVVLLGVIKAGGAFILLDASQPALRLRSMCEMIQSKITISSTRYLDVAVDLGPPVLSVDTIITTPPDCFVPVPVRSDSPLYAGFTSGSTGEPKGFIIEQSAFLSGLEAFSRRLNLNKHSRVFQFASYSFVVSITGQLAPLLSGACLCVPSQHQLENDLAGAMRTMKANWVALTPSVARMLEPRNVPALQTVVMVGESMTQSDLSKWHQADLFSLYGQSENSKGTMICRKTATSDAGSIGYPYCATGWVVDHTNHNRLVPVGAEGELVLEGPCLTTEYLKNVEQTSATFITNPSWLGRFRGQCEGRFFKTGDVVRQDPIDGSFHFVGRKGSRVKIRGQRVELGEVESKIRLFVPTAHAVVAEIICSADDIDGQSPILVAFILEEANGNAEVSVLSKPSPGFRNKALLLKSKLCEALPGYMIPGAFISLAALPRTATGKVHRRYLRECASKLTRRELLEYTVVRAAYRKPESDDEATLQAICEKVLSLPHGQVGMDDTFLDLGGDSLTARRVISLARAQGVSLLLTDILQQSTLASILRHRTPRSEDLVSVGPHLDPFQKLRDEFLTSLPSSLDPSDVEDVFPALELQAAYASNHVVDCFPLHISGCLDVARLRRACQSLVERYSNLRTVFHSMNGQLLQVILRRLELSFTVQECPSFDDALRWTNLFAEAELKKRYAIDQPIIGFVLVQASLEQRHILIMRLSHGQYDALCLRPVIHSLWEAYRNEPIREQTDFKTHVQRCFELRTPKAYATWRNVLRGAPPPQLPFTPISLAPAGKNATIAVQMRQLGLQKPPPGTTTATMMKAAWFQTLRRETGRDDIVFGQFVHGWAGVEGVVGPCMNMIPVRVKFQPDWTGRQLLQKIQSQHAATSSFDTMGWKDIVTNCTDWPKGTQVDSVVLHQNFDRNIELRFDDITCRKEMPILSNWPVFPLLLVTHPGQGSVDALLLASTEFGGERHTNRLLGIFARALLELQDDPDRLLE